MANNSNSNNYTSHRPSPATTAERTRTRKVATPSSLRTHPAGSTPSKIQIVEQAGRSDSWPVCPTTLICLSQVVRWARALCRSLRRRELASPTLQAKTKSSAMGTLSTPMARCVPIPRRPPRTWRTDSSKNNRCAFSSWENQGRTRASSKSQWKMAVALLKAAW